MVIKLQGVIDNEFLYSCESANCRLLVSVYTSVLPIARHGVLSIIPKNLEISVRSQMERSVSVRSNQNIWDHL